MAKRKNARAKATRKATTAARKPAKKTAVKGARAKGASASSRAGKKKTAARATRKAAKKTAPKKTLKAAAKKAAPKRAKALKPVKAVKAAKTAKAIKKAAKVSKAPVKASPVKAAKTVKAAKAVKAVSAAKPAARKPAKRKAPVVAIAFPGAPAAPPEAVVTNGSPAKAPKAAPRKTKRDSAGARERATTRHSEPSVDRPSIPSSLNVDRTASQARSGGEEMREQLREHTESSPVLTAGDVDADWEQAYSSGDEAPGGDNPTPDQDRVDEIGRALGVEYQDGEELKGADKISDRDKHRWELDPASAEDYPDHDS